MSRAIVATLLFWGLRTAGLCASIPAVETTNVPQLATWEDFGGAIASTTVGWSFSIGSQDISVTGLGVLDINGSGLANSHEIGIWDSSQNLLTSVNVPAGTAATLDSNYRFVTITPVTLTAGKTYVIGAFYPSYPGAGDPATVNDQIIVNSMQTISSSISFGQSRQGILQVGGAFGYPSIDAGLPQGVFGPNFEIAVSTPVRLQSFSVD